MERLEACYFCGTAEDAPLREVAVTPRRRQGDPDAAVTLTLCRPCERKLKRVLSGLFERVESRQSSGTTGTDADVADEAAPEPDEQLADDPEPIDRIDVTASGSADEPTGGRERSPGPTDEGDESADDETEPADEPEPEDDEPEADDAEIIEEESTVTARATVNSKEALDGVSVAEYNKVMRLLQNREFPMERAAFVDLAANAYDLAEETVETVLEAVIDQGSLADRKGELVRPGEGEP